MIPVTKDDRGLIDETLRVEPMIRRESTNASEARIVSRRRCGIAPVAVNAAGIVLEEVVLDQLREQHDENVGIVAKPPAPRRRGKSPRGDPRHSRSVHEGVIGQRRQLADDGLLVTGGHLRIDVPE